ncbi:MAG: DUF362 domain-containing protein [Isosphaeraceae bacterium]
MDKPVQVAVVRSDRRRGAVAEALSLIAPDLGECVGRDPNPVVIPDLEHPGRPWSCTHRDTLSAALDAILAADASSVSIVGGPASAQDESGHPVQKLGYSGEFWGRYVRFAGLDPANGLWSTIRWIGPGGEPFSFRANPLVAASRCRISLAVAKTHETFRLALGLANLVGAIHPEDRASVVRRRAGSGPGMGSRVAAILESGRGMLVDSWLALRSVSGGMRLTGRERRHVDAVEQATGRLATLAAFLKPAVSVVDGFSAMHGEGPRHGRRVALNTVVAGTDPVAVDAVAATIMGFEPNELALLREAQALGLGTADLARITIVGDPVARVRRKVRPHSADPLLRLAGRTEAGQTAVRRPHFGRQTAPRREGLDAHRH